MTMNEAMYDGLTRMAGACSSTRKIDHERVRWYLEALEGDEIQPADVEGASRWFTRDGDGTFPAGPVFRKRCQIERDRRISRQKAAVYESKRLAARDDPFSDDADEWVSQEEARKIIAAALARLDAKFKDNPLTRKDKTRRQLDREVKELQRA